MIDYQAWLLKGGSTLTTVGFYTRNIRAVFNDAIAAKAIPKEQYPFGKGQYVCPSGSGNKRSKSADEIGLIMEYPAACEMSLRSRDFWVLAYLMNGLNPTDLIQLRQKDVDIAGESFSFVRKKTMRESTTGTAISGFLLPEAIEIIQRWRSGKTGKGEYLFPFLDPSMSEDQKHTAISTFIRTTSRWMALICNELGIQPVSWQHARHSYAMAMLNADAPLALISASMGHTTIKTTQRYVSSLNSEKVKGFARALIPQKL